MKTLLTTLCLCCVLLVQAQQDPMYSQYMFNTLSINPAYAGSARLLTVNALARQQWTGFDGAPSTQTLTAHYPALYRTLGVGATVVNDATGPIKTTGFHADLAYRSKVGLTSWLCFGLKGGLNYVQANLTALERQDYDDLAYFRNIEGKVMPNFGFGAYFYSTRFYMGLSAPRLLKGNLGVNALEQNEVVVATERRHFFFIAGLVLDVMPKVKYKPTVLIKAVEDGAWGWDMTHNVLLNDKFWVGVLYRHQDAVGLLLQYQLSQQLALGYAYDLPISKLAPYTAGSHELMLRYDFSFSNGKIQSPRYF